MKSAVAAVLFALLLAPAAALAAAPAADDAVFVEGTRYDAVLDPEVNAWRLLPATGADLQLRVSERCGAGAAATPPGLWLLSSDAAGRPELQAFSATPLPRGHSGRIPLVACGDAVTGALALPPGLIAWLQQNSGTIYVAR
ncbi:MAG TPA: hypothetical protein VLK29_09760 [Luteimonas sp.]|nr:hypothetical protein [Luteimonas sp.]